jgi:hypothetical protein
VRAREVFCGGSDDGDDGLVVVVIHYRVVFLFTRLCGGEGVFSFSLHQPTLGYDCRAYHLHHAYPFSFHLRLKNRLLNVGWRLNNI